MMTPIASLALLFGSVAASAGSGPSAREIGVREAACNRSQAVYAKAVDAATTAGRVYDLGRHPSMKSSLMRSYSDCLAAVVYDASNPDYNLSIGMMMLVLSRGLGPNDVHLHGIGYIQNAAAYAYRKNEPIVEARACAMAATFALPGEFRCSPSDIARANHDAEAAYAKLVPERLRQQREADESVQALIVGAKT